ncbi:MAG: MFS transporter [Chloroflexota bacterium]|nr:MFS transporter [Chloroflexota bacterium]
MFAATLTGGAGFSVFIPAVSEDLGWSRSTLTGALGLGTIVGALIAPFAGRVIDRVGSRAVLTASGIGIAIALVVVAGARAEVVFVVAYALARAIDMGVLNLAVTTAVSNWFVRRRGRALGIAMTGNAIGVMLLVPVCQWLIDGPGWRVAWLVVGGGSGLILAVAAGLLLRRRPEDLGLRTDGEPVTAPKVAHPAVPVAPAASAGVGEPPPAATSDVEPTRVVVPPTAVAPELNWTAHHAARSPAFWLLVLASSGSQLAVSGVTTSQVSILVENGLSTAAAAGAVSAYGFSWTIGALLWGVIIERLAAQRALALASLVVAGCVAAVLFVRDPLAAMAYALVYGFANGGKEALDAVIWADYFGRRSVGAIRGLSRPVVVGSGALGAYAGGLGYDLTGGYEVVMLLFVLCALGSGLAALAAAPPRAIGADGRPA